MDEVEYLTIHCIGRVVELCFDEVCVEARAVFEAASRFDGPWGEVRARDVGAQPSQ